MAGGIFLAGKPEEGGIWSGGGISQEGGGILHLFFLFLLYGLEIDNFLCVKSIHLCMNMYSVYICIVCRGKTITFKVKLNMEYL